MKIINELPKEISEAALKVHKSLSGSSVTDFICVLDTNIGPFCDVMIKKQDKKKDRQILFGHRQSLLEQLGSSSDPALTLHLAALVIFYHCHGAMLHASGKFVPTIIEHLESQPDCLTPDQITLLREQQKLVIQSLNKNIAEEERAELTTKLEAGSAGIVNLVKSLKKSSPSE